MGSASWTGIGRNRDKYRRSSAKGAEAGYDVARDEGQIAAMHLDHYLRWVRPQLLPGPGDLRPVAVPIGAPPGGRDGALPGRPVCARRRRDEEADAARAP